MIRARLRYWRAVLVWLGYFVRPYDMPADRRRWAWQPPAPCGLRGVPREIRAALLDAVRERDA